MIQPTERQSSRRDFLKTGIGLGIVAAYSGMAIADILSRQSRRADAASSDPIVNKLKSPEQTVALYRALGGNPTFSKEAFYDIVEKSGKNMVVRGAIEITPQGETTLAVKEYPLLDEAGQQVQIHPLAVDTGSGGRMVVVGQLSKNVTDAKGWISLQGSTAKGETFTIPDRGPVKGVKMVEPAENNDILYLDTYDKLVPWDIANTKIYRRNKDKSVSLVQTSFNPYWSRLLTEVIGAKDNLSEHVWYSSFNTEDGHVRNRVKGTTIEKEQINQGEGQPALICRFQRSGVDILLHVSGSSINPTIYKNENEIQVPSSGPYIVVNKNLSQEFATAGIPITAVTVKETSLELVIALAVSNIPQMLPRFIYLQSLDNPSDQRLLSIKGIPTIGIRSDGGVSYPTRCKSVQIFESNGRKIILGYIENAPSSPDNGYYYLDISNGLNQNGEWKRVDSVIEYIEPPLPAPSPTPRPIPTPSPSNSAFVPIVNK